MRFDNSSHRRLPPSRGKLPIKNNCRLLLPVLGINILSLNFVFVNLSRYVRKALFSLLKGARGSFYRLRFQALFRQPPRFSSNENRSPFSFLRLRTFWRAGVYAAGGAMHRIVQNPVSKHNKNPTNIVGFFWRSVSNVNRIIIQYTQLKAKYLFDDI